MQNSQIFRGEESPTRQRKTSCASDGSKTLVRFLEFGTLKDRPKQGRQRITTEKQDRLIVQVPRRNRTVSCPELQWQLLQATDISVSVETIRQNTYSKFI